ncbi:MAG: Hsp20 family protein [Pseudomonadota bacterium]
MRNYDLTPLYRSTVGFDRVFDLLESMSNAKVESGGYPPYNIERVAENDYRITLAVAGFGEDDIDIEVHENELKVTGTKPGVDDGREFLHQGIAGRAFERRFQLAEHVLVVGASLKNGLLNLDLRRDIPEAKKPRRIAINGQNVSPLKVSKATDAA